MLPFRLGGGRVWRRLFSSAVMSQGKCKGLTHEECLAQMPQYCSWLLTQQKSLGKEYDDLKEYLLSRAKADPALQQALEAENAANAEIFADLPPGGDRAVGFGKYEALTYEELLKADPRYCSWVKEQYKTDLQEGEEMSMDFRAFGEYLQGVQLSSFGTRTRTFSRRGNPSYASRAPSANGSLADGKWLINFGRHKGSTFAEVYAKHPDYCEFMVNEILANEDGQVNAQSCSFAVYILHASMQSVQAQKAEPPK
ncbi:unnamed protein product [Durusdinium trenchii]|uniref:Uncharacterized protein n=2 Tax=Durusdinium trenchii TaxID=1381693 RepID=A0ABP0H4N1_9DINO